MRFHDFIHVYGGYLWKVGWIADNEVFAWHKNAKESEIKKAEEIAKTNRDLIDQMFDNNEAPFSTIWKKV